MLFVLEGNTDIRFVTGLSEKFNLTIFGPRESLRKEGGLLARIKQQNLDIPVIEVEGGRLRYQIKSLLKLIIIAKKYDVLFSQENLRGTLSAGLAGRLRGVKVISHSGMPPREYFRCRYTRGQISPIKYRLGDFVINGLIKLNAKLCSYWLVLGPFLYQIFSPYKKEVGLAHYYGVDSELYHPVEDPEKERLKIENSYHPEDFVIFFSSRVSHEKDPETVLKAVYALKKESPHRRILLMNLGGGHKKMRELAISLGFDDCDDWLVTRPAAHPMIDLPRYYQLSDLVIQSSLEEGLGLSPLEAMACEIPVIASDVGGMKAHLHPYALMVPKQNVKAMKEAILKVMEGDPQQLPAKAKGREYVVNNWSRSLAFDNLYQKVNEIISAP